MTKKVDSINARAIAVQRDYFLQPKVRPDELHRNAVMAAVGDIAHHIKATEITTVRHRVRFTVLPDE